MNPDLRSFMWVAGSSIARLPLAIAVSALLARTLGPDGMGTWTMLMAAATLLHAGLLNWTQPAGVRFGREEWLACGSFSAIWSGRWPLIVLGMAIVVTLVVAHPSTWLARWYRVPGDLHWLALLAVLGLWAAAEAQSVSQIRGGYRALAFGSIGAPAASLCFLAIVLPGLGQHQPGIDEVLIGVLGLSAFTWAVALLFLWPRTRPVLPKPNGAQIRKCMRFAWPLIPGVVVGYAASWGYQIVLQQQLGERAVGLFYVPYQLVMTVLAASAPVGIVLLPRLIGAASFNEAAARNLLSTVIPTLAAIWLVLAIPMIAVLPDLLRVLYGDAFLESRAVLAVLCIAIPSGIIPTLYGQLFTLQSRLARYMIVYAGCTTMLGLTAAIAFGATLGITGIAAICTCATMIGHCAYLVDQHRRLAVPLAPTGACLLIAASYPVTVLCFSIDSWLRLALGLTCLGVLILTMKRSRVVDPTTLRRVFEGFPRLQRSMLAVFIAASERRAA